MTRINSAIPVKNLTDEHLLAEHREIKRLPSCLAKAIKSGSIDKIPEKFTLGKGHVLFFLDKMSFIRQRYVKIYNECTIRGMNVQTYLSSFDNIESKYMNEYTTTKEEHVLLVERIRTRITESKREIYHYRSKRINKDEAIRILET